MRDPIQFNSDFGDTAALMLTIASPRASDVDIALRARSIRNAIEATRAAEGRRAPQPRVSIVYAFPISVSPNLVRDAFVAVLQAGGQNKYVSDAAFLFRQRVYWSRRQLPFKR